MATTIDSFNACASLSGSYGRFDTTWDNFMVGGKEGAVSLAVTGSYYHSGEPKLPDFYPDEFAWYRDRYVPFGEVLIPPDQVVTLDENLRRRAARSIERMFELTAPTRAATR